MQDRTVREGIASGVSTNHRDDLRMIMTMSTIQYGVEPAKKQRRLSHITPRDDLLNYGTWRRNHETPRVRSDVTFYTGAVYRQKFAIMSFHNFQSLISLSNVCPFVKALIPILHPFTRVFQVGGQANFFVCFSFDKSCVKQSKPSFLIMGLILSIKVPFLLPCFLRLSTLLKRHDHGILSILISRFLFI